MKILGVIPARYLSSRFPRKVLAKIDGYPMIQWVYERAKRSALLTDLCVATDHQKVFKVVEEFGGKAYLTDSRHKSGSDRIAEVIERFQPDADLIVNIQGDEPLIDPAAIDLAINVLLSNSHVKVSTLVRPLKTTEELEDPNVVKVVLAQDQRAIFFSRSPIPYYRDGNSYNEWLAQYSYLKHIGIYVFRRDALMDFVSWPPGRLEMIEKLEQLRFLEHDVDIQVALTEYNSLSVDTPKDLEEINLKINTTPDKLK